MAESSQLSAGQKTLKRDPYEILGVPKTATADQIKSAYRKLALKFHPDKNDSPEATESFKEVATAYAILSDPDKKRQYDAHGYDGVDMEAMEMELDLSSLGTVNTMFAALFSKLGVPIKTAVAPSILEAALSGQLPAVTLPWGVPIQAKVEKQHANYYKLVVTQEHSDAGVVVRVTSHAQSKFKLLLFDPDPQVGGYNLVAQEDSVKAGKVTAAGFYFLNFKLHRLDPTVNPLHVAKDPEAALFKRLDGLQPAEVTRLDAGEHIFAVYGDNFFKSATYSIEALVVDKIAEVKDKVENIERILLDKRNDLKAFETVYRDAVAKYAEVTQKYAVEKKQVDELLGLRDKIYAEFSSEVLPQPFTEEVEDEDASPSAEKKRKKRWWGVKSLSSKQ
ncbi:hypothetical protein KFL_002250020 [Klebsormidium nitens]|uniref:J domain-containing protein n=1 Tax=Klebsormidium nitens TaxID=105231 RepID=A0A1Y1I5J3_KLENI|nr:hypothetical protein KFL_002250020 [Klebsormidium nitens]|eukprot:GAQ85222.1 hypothetical protein KFL_002250020 [Klebsormidium nitens]